MILYSYKFLVAKHFKFKHTHFLSSSLEINMKVATIFLLSLIGLSAVKASPPSLEDQLSYQKKHPLLTCVPGVTATTLCTDACPKEKAYVQCLGHLCQGYEMNGDPFLQSDFLEQCNRVQAALNTACPTVPCDLQCSSVGNGCNIEQPDFDSLDNRHWDGFWSGFFGNFWTTFFIIFPFAVGLSWWRKRKQASQQVSPSQQVSQNSNNKSISLLSIAEYTPSQVV